MNQHAVIMAGGVGSRLWPMSRQSSPKQFQKLIGNETLIGDTFIRLSKIVNKKNIWVITTEDYRALTQEVLPDINPGHIIGEPEGRNTAPAVGYATLKILEEDKDANISVSPADHYIGNIENFCVVANCAYDYLAKHPEFLITLGINPTYPHTGYGYIKQGSELKASSKCPIFKVDKFVEKPDLSKAEEYLKTKQYLWNGGYFFFHGAQLIKYFERYLPNTLPLLRSTLGGNSSAYGEIEKVSIDVAIAEKVTDIAVIRADFDWSDIGDWSALHDIVKDRGEGTKNHLATDTFNTMVIPKDRLIATVGIEDCVIIDTGDAILVCNKKKVQGVKDIVELLKKNNMEQFL